MTASSIAWDRILQPAPFAVAVFDHGDRRLGQSPSFVALELTMHEHVHELLQAVSETTTAFTQSLTLASPHLPATSANLVVRAVVWWTPLCKVLAVIDDTELALRESAADALVHTLERNLRQARSAAARSGAHLDLVAAVLRFVNGSMCIIEPDGRIAKVVSPKFADLVGHDVVGQHIGGLMGGVDGRALDEIYRMYVNNPSFSPDKLRVMSQVEWYVDGRRLGLHLEPVEDGEAGASRWAVAVIEDLTFLSRRALLEAITKDTRALMVLASTSPDVFRMAHLESAQIVRELQDLAGQVALAGDVKSRDLLSVRATIHSLKSITASHAMHGTTERLHAVESALEDVDDPAVLGTLLEVVDTVGEIERIFGDVAAAVRVTDAINWVVMTRDDHAKFLRVLEEAQVPAAVLQLGRWLAFRPAEQLFGCAATLADEAQRRAKEVRVIVEGGDTLVDMSRLTGALESLPHLVRNALAHGIETVDERKRRGKPPCATLRLSVRLIEQSLVIAVQDDGTGLSPGKIRAKAEALGLPIPPVLDNANLLALISTPEFSMASTTDTLAGRGQGMGAVSNAVQRMGAHLHLFNREGQGAHFEIVVPNPPQAAVAIGRATIDAHLQAMIPRAA